MLLQEFYDACCVSQSTEAHCLLACRRRWLEVWDNKIAYTCGLWNVDNRSCHSVRRSLYASQCEQISISRIGWFVGTLNHPLICSFTPNNVPDDDCTWWIDRNRVKSGSKKTFPVTRLISRRRIEILTSNLTSRWWLYMVDQKKCRGGPTTIFSQLG